MLQLRSSHGLFKKAPAYAIQNSVSYQSLITKRTGMILAGVFIMAAILEMVGIDARGTGAQSGIHNSSQSHSASSDNQNNTNNGSAKNTPSLSNSDSSTSSNLSTNVQSTTSGNGDSSTHVSVNGQPVSVPSNGSVTKTIRTPGGTTTYTVSNSRDSQGNATNSSTSSSSLNVSSSSNSNVDSSTNIEEDSSP